jgi:hypothetical protein
MTAVACTHECDISTCHNTLYPQLNIPLLLVWIRTRGASNRTQNLSFQSANRISTILDVIFPLLTHMDTLELEEPKKIDSNTAVPSSEQPRPDFPKLQQDDRDVERQFPEDDKYRLYGVSRQWPTILCALCSVFLLAFTAIYASDGVFSSSVRFVSPASSRVIFILSALSGLQGFSLAATIQGTIESLRWVLISRPGGIALLLFLGLDPATGTTGLLRLVFNRKSSFLGRERFATLMRLTASILIPILGVLVMSTDRSGSPEMFITLMKCR